MKSLYKLISMIFQIFLAQETVRATAILLLTSSTEFCGEDTGKVFFWWLFYEVDVCAGSLFNNN